MNWNPFDPDDDGWMLDNFPVWVAIIGVVALILVLWGCD